MAYQLAKCILGVELKIIVLKQTEFYYSNGEQIDQIFEISLSFYV